MSDLAARTGLPDRAIDSIRQVLAACPAVEQAVLYGSRAKGNYKRGSDIDLTLKGDALTYRDLLRLMDDLDELLPYRSTCRFMPRSTIPRCASMSTGLGWCSTHAETIIMLARAMPPRAGSG